MVESVAGVALQDDEEVQHTFRPSWAAWFWPIVLTVGLWTPIVWLQRQQEEYIVTDRRVIHKAGKISTSTDEFRLSDVARLQTERTLGEKLLGGGTIVLDTGVDELVMKAVPDHDAVVSTIRAGQSA